MAAGKKLRWLDGRMLRVSGDVDGCHAGRVDERNGTSPGRARDAILDTHRARQEYSGFTRVWVAFFVLPSYFSVGARPLAVVGTGAVRSICHPLARRRQSEVEYRGVAPNLMKKDDGEAVECERGSRHFYFYRRTANWRPTADAKQSVPTPERKPL